MGGQPSKLSKLHRFPGKHRAGSVQRLERCRRLLRLLRGNADEQSLKEAKRSGVHAEHLGVPARDRKHEVDPPTQRRSQRVGDKKRTKLEACDFIEKGGQFTVNATIGKDDYKVAL